MHWKDYFTTGTVKPDAPEYIRKACRIIDFANLGKEEREVAFALEKGQAIYDAGLVSSYLDGKDDGKAEGIVEGKAEGKAERNVEFAINMMANGEPIDKIALYTGLKTDQIKTLQPVS